MNINGSKYTYNAGSSESTIQGDASALQYFDKFLKGEAINRGKL